MYSNNSDAALTGFLAGRADNNNNGCCNGNGMWGDNSWWIVIILFALIFGWNGNGGFGGGNNGAANFIPYAIGNSYTDSAVQRGFDTQAIIGKLDGINQGLCDGFYTMNTGMLNATNNLSSAVCNLGYEQAQLANATQVALLQGFNAAQAQAADCCCKTQTAIAGVNNAITGLGCSLGREIERGFSDTNYNMATNTCAITTQMANNTRDIIDNQNANTRSILDYLCQEKISDLQNENNALRLSASQAAQNLAIGARIDAATAEILRKTGAECPMPAYVVQPPAPVTFPTNCCGQVNYAGFGNNGCGCGCN